MLQKKVTTADVTNWEHFKRSSIMHELIKTKTLHRHYEYEEKQCIQCGVQVVRVPATRTQKNNWAKNIFLRNWIWNFLLTMHYLRIQRRNSCVASTFTPSLMHFFILLYTEKFCKPTQNIICRQKIQVKLGFWEMDTSSWHMHIHHIERWCILSSLEKNYGTFKIFPGWALIDIQSFSALI